ncbi:16S rRNA (guanine(966)-N(2))-methyltransferase [Rosenbergiella australiborealis]|uniref:Ribosomal RNA small subunit methyltransferase D n=1 Tax=Rosenbergiella australiborealis TaxID=1544696 RepID=A0ABS5T4S5_9GAMM|nr:16S rRNA (guanine(966)-N(2))-methyltransferase [Rosenbergiella australiborealis]MBT0727360.1 16S rRNA (guanine(966)-N(2))-methyltransferase [Rosenbergiella australiborealis]
MSKSAGKIGQIRIIGGQWRGRKLSVLDSEGLRPTTDRVRETLFNWLAPWLPQANCLDCYAGSGALGIEALSRYAETVTLIEKDAQVARQLQQNIQMLNTSKLSLHRADTLQFLAQSRPDVPYNIVFIDPPFRQGLLDQTIKLLETYQWLAEDAVIYTENEVEQGMPSVPHNWILYREKVAGQVCYRLYHRQ